MTADLAVDITLLQNTAGMLNLLMEEFDNSGKILDDYNEYIGDKDVIGALHDFSENWDAHKKKLVGSMDAVAQMAGDAADTFITADDQLAAAISHDNVSHLHVAG